MASRTEKSFINVLTGVGSKLIIFVFAFIVRTIFIRTLGAEYNGINGTFSNLLSILCLADLGIENVLSYALYKELKGENKVSISRLIASFKKVYLAFAIFILASGMAVVPFLGFIVNTTISMGEVYLYFFLYLLNSVATYLFVYKTTILAADQKQYIVNIVFSVSRIVMYILQSISLLWFKSMYWYLAIQILCTVIYNLVLNLITVRRYPYLKRIDKQHNLKLDLSLKNNIKANLLYRASTVAIDNTDTIIISATLGTSIAGLYSNYYLLIQYVAGIIWIFGNGLLGSIGNLNAEEDIEKSVKNFKLINYLYSIIGTVYLCCFVNCIQQFIPIWIGEAFLLDRAFMVLMVFSFYLGIIMRPVMMFRETMGLFSQVRKSMAIAAILNIILSLLLGIKWGLVGIVAATIISKLVTQFWYEPIVLYKKFERSPMNYFSTEAKKLLTSFVCLAISGGLCSLISTAFLGIILRAFVTFIICIFVSVALNLNSEENATFVRKIVSLLKKVF